jgi:hypothetical protein
MSNYQLPVTNYHLPVTNYHLPVTNHQQQIMQNKPNLLNTQMNVSSVKTKHYENKRLCSRKKNKPNQTQFMVSLSNQLEARRGGLPVVSLSNHTPPILL